MSGIKTSQLELDLPLNALIDAVIDHVSAVKEKLQLAADLMEEGSEDMLEEPLRETLKEIFSNLTLIWTTYDIDGNTEVPLALAIYYGGHVDSGAELCQIDAEYLIGEVDDVDYLHRLMNLCADRLGVLEAEAMETKKP